MILSVLAVVLAVVALVLAFAIPGPTGAVGATGATGPRGPAGPGTLMGYVYASGTTAVAATCTEYVGANITLAVPGPGNVTLTMGITFLISHASGTSDHVVLFGGIEPNACSSNAGGHIYLPATEATGSYELDASGIARFVISAAGTYTFAVGAMASSGTVDFWYGSATAVYYPG